VRKASDRLSTALAEVQAWARRELPRMDDQEATGARSVLNVVNDILRWEIESALEEEVQRNRDGLTY
jgi:hypothetical protein